MENQFKKIESSEMVTTENGFVSNGIWIFRRDWLESFPCSGNRYLRARARRVAAETVSAKLTGNGGESSYGIVAVLAAVNLTTFRAAETVYKIRGYKNGRAEGKKTVAFRIGGTKGPAIDADFHPALTWDPQAVPMVRGEMDPVALVKGGEIVALICPIKLLEKTNY